MGTSLNYFFCFVVLYYSLCLKRTSVLSGQIVWSRQCPLKTESTVYYILLYRPFVMKQKKTLLKCVNFNFGSLFPCELHRKFTSSVYSILCTLLLPLFSQLYSCGHTLGSSSPYVVLVRGWGGLSAFYHNVQQCCIVGLLYCGKDNWAILLLAGRV